MVYLILQSVASSLHMHELGIWIVELAFTQLAVETHNLPKLILHFFNVFKSCKETLIITTHSAMLDRKQPNKNKASISSFHFFLNLISSEKKLRNTALLSMCCSSLH